MLGEALVLQTNELLIKALEVFEHEFGRPSRKRVKVWAWDIRPDLGLVVQLDQPMQPVVLVWLPYPEDGQNVPEIAKEYPAHAGRHSNTYASPGLGRDLPALRLSVTREQELAATVEYVKAYRDSKPLPEVKTSASASGSARLPRRAIPRSVQREVWERDQGRCVQCGAKDRLHFDHIVPFSKGGGNSALNIQILCERCNLSKGNRI